MLVAEHILESDLKPVLWRCGVRIVLCSLPASTIRRIAEILIKTRLKFLLCMGKVGWRVDQKAIS